MSYKKISNYNYLLELHNIDVIMLFIIQIVVNVQDGGVPPLSFSSTVTMTVIRNTAPFFPAPKTTTITIPDTKQSGSEVTTYTATDNDGRVKHL